MNRSERTARNAALLKEGLRICLRCEETKELSEYKKSGGGKWYNSTCKSCDSILHAEYRSKDLESYNEKQRIRYQENKAHYRDLARKSMYGAPLGTFDVLMEIQNKKCAICGAFYSAQDGRSLSLDHDHETNDFRGLLCTPCNQGIGAFRHDIDLLRKAIDYLLDPGYNLDELKELIDSKYKGSYESDMSLEDLGL